MTDDSTKKTSPYGKMVDKIQQNNNPHQKGNNSPKPKKGHSSTGIVKRTGRGR